MKTLLAGRSDMDQLNRIFTLLGSPSEAMWPGYADLPKARLMGGHGSAWRRQPFNTLRQRFPGGSGSADSGGGGGGGGDGGGGGGGAAFAFLNSGNRSCAAKATAGSFGSSAFDLSDCGLDLLNSMLTYDPAKRITASEALAHPLLF